MLVDSAWTVSMRPFVLAVLAGWHPCTVASRLSCDVYRCICYCHCHWRQSWNNHILTFQWVPKVRVQRCELTDSLSAIQSILFFVLSFRCWLCRLMFRWYSWDDGVMSKIQYSHDWSVKKDDSDPIFPSCFECQLYKGLLVHASTETMDFHATELEFRVGQRGLGSTESLR